MKKLTKTKRLIDRLFHDKTGSYVIGQPPNIPVVLAVIALIGTYVAQNNSMLERFFELFAFGSVFLWTYLEIMYGESLFRRVLGVVVLIALFIRALI